jgi:FkbM family methyltransferase
MGIAVSYPGKLGVSYGEERFLERIGPFLAGRTVIDVGANVGSYSRAVKRFAPTASVHAFEPHPRLFAKLSEAGGHAGFHTVPLALGKESQRGKLFDFADVAASTQASLSREAVGFFGRGTQEFDVQVTTLDEFLAERDIDDVALLKIDTEGFDLDVLCGARRALERRQIDVIQFEIIPADVVCRVFLKDFFDLLSDYSINRLCLNGKLIALRPYQPKYCEIFSMSILVAVRNDVTLPS